MPYITYYDYMIIMLHLFTSGARQNSYNLLHKSSRVMKEFENFSGEKDIAINC